MLDQASKELQEALKLDPSLANNDEVKALQGKLGKKSPTASRVLSEVLRVFILPTEGLLPATPGLSRNRIDLGNR